MRLTERLKSFWRQPLYQFLIKAVLLYLIWYFAYELWLHPQTNIDLMVIKNLEDLSAILLEGLGYVLIPESEVNSIRTLGIDGTHGVWIGDPCNGLELFALFTGFVIAYPGKLRSKLWYIPLGMLAIHLLNTIRISSLAAILYYTKDPEVLDFNHTYTFTILVYGIVFYLWYIWVEKFGNKALSKQS